MNAINTNTNRGNQIFIQQSNVFVVYNFLFYRRGREVMAKRRVVLVSFALTQLESVDVLSAR